MRAVTVASCGPASLLQYTNENARNALVNYLLLRRSTLTTIAGSELPYSLSSTLFTRHLMANFAAPPLPTTQRVSHTAPLCISLRRAPRQFVRLHRVRDDVTVLQTASTTYTSQTLTLHIHSVVHMADKNYYESLQRTLDEMRTGLDKSAVLYELIAPRELRQRTKKGGLRRVEGVRATAGLRRTARRLGCVAQADVMDVGKEGWYVADLSAEEVRRIGRGMKEEFGVKKRGIVSRWMRGVGQVVVAGLLPGPEVFGIMTTMGGDGEVLNGEIVWRVLRRLVVGDVRGARRILYGERVVFEGKGDSAGNDVGVRRDVEVFEGVREMAERGVQEVGVVYGAWHGGHLCRWAEEEMGMRWGGTEWRCALEIYRGGGGGWVEGIWGIVVGMGFLWYGGWDWIGVVKGVIGEGELGDWGEVGSVLGWYLLRHLAGYVALTRWLVVTG